MTKSQQLGPRVSLPFVDGKSRQSVWQKLRDDLIDCAVRKLAGNCASEQEQWDLYQDSGLSPWEREGDIAQKAKTRSLKPRTPLRTQEIYRSQCVRLVVREVLCDVTRSTLCVGSSAKQSAVPKCVPSRSHNQWEIVMLADAQTPADSRRKITRQYLVATDGLDAPATTNQEVAGSSPAGRANKFKILRVARDDAIPSVATALRRVQNRQFRVQPA